MPDSPDLLVLEENTRGRDIIVGDLHGDLERLRAIIADLQPHDRLFLAGDIIDNRHAQANELLDHSHQLIQLINDHNADPEKPHIYVVQGNHEQVCLNALTQSNNPTKFAQYIDPTYGGGWITRTTDAERETIKNSIKAMPIIIRINGRIPCNIVHADMPIDDAELLSRIAAGNFKLSAPEIDYALNARKKADYPQHATPIKKTGRGSHASITYSGHSPFGGVRIDTNSINLDTLTYKSNATIAVIHGHYQAKIYGEVNAEYKEHFLKCKKNIDRQLYDNYIRNGAKAIWIGLNDSARSTITVAPLIASYFNLDHRYHKKIADSIALPPLTYDLHKAYHRAYLCYKLLLNSYKVSPEQITDNLIAIKSQTDFNEIQASLAAALALINNKEITSSVKKIEQACMAELNDNDRQHPHNKFYAICSLMNLIETLDVIKSAASPQDKFDRIALLETFANDSIKLQPKPSSIREKILYFAIVATSMIVCAAIGAIIGFILGSPTLPGAFASMTVGAVVGANKGFVIGSAVAGLGFGIVGQESHLFFKQKKRAATVRGEGFFTQARKIVESQPPQQQSTKESVNPATPLLN